MLLIAFPLFPLALRRLFLLALLSLFLLLDRSYGINRSLKVKRPQGALEVQWNIVIERQAYLNDLFWRQKCEVCLLEFARMVCNVVLMSSYGNRA